MVDAVIESFATKNEMRLAALIHFVPVRCTLEMGLGAFPCLPGETEGTLGYGFGQGSCEGSVNRGSPALANRIARELMGSPKFDARVFAVQSLEQNDDAQYRVLYNLVFASGVALGLDEIGVVSSRTPCGGGPERTLLSNAEMVLPPK